MREGLVSTHGWTHTEDAMPRAVDIARNVDDWPLAAIIYTDIARDGTLTGPNLAATAMLTKAVRKVPIIHSGGVAKLADITALKQLDIAGIIVGKAIYEHAAGCGRRGEGIGRVLTLHISTASHRL